MNIIIEKAKPADGKALTLVQKHSFDDDSRRFFNREAGGPPGYASLGWNMSVIRSNMFYKIRLEDYTIIGGIIIKQLENGSYYLLRLFIDPKYQGRGIGHQAMKFLGGEFKDAVRWTLDTPKASLRNCYFYEKHGFVKVKDEGELRYYERR